MGEGHLVLCFPSGPSSTGGMDAPDLSFGRISGSPAQVSVFKGSGYDLM